MKNYALLILTFITVFSCKQEIDTASTISKIFDAHGGIKKWNALNTFAFKTNDEHTITDLKNRYSLIKSNDYQIGYDGKDVWLKNIGDNSYKGNPKFYYNLMFYFVAMPFILADDGIIYTKTEPLIFEDKSYPGIKISYNEGIGESPDDEYIIYYNPETYKMEWLAYTVTYFTKEKSKKWSFINYSDWQIVEDLTIPKTLTWYKTNGFTIKEKSKEKTVKLAILSTTKANTSLFTKPEDAIIVE